MPDRKRDDDRVVRDAFGEQIVAGEGGRQPDKTEVDLVAVERLELFGAGHVEKVERDARRELSERSERCRQQPVVDVRHVADVEMGAFSAIHPLHGGDAFLAHREQFL